MEGWICPVCKSINNEHEKYCKDCGTWLLSTKFPAKNVVKPDSPVKKYDKRLKKVYIFESVIIALFGFLIWAGSNKINNANNFAGFIFFSGLILLVSSVLLTIILIIFKRFNSNKKGIRNHFILSICLMVFGIVIFSMETKSSPTLVKPSTTTPNKIAEVNTNQKKEEPVKEVFNIGDIIQLDKNVLTVIKVERSSGTQFDNPAKGKEYVIVTVQIQNAGDVNISYNPFDFKMANSQGQIVNQSFTIVNKDTQLNSGQLAPGGRVTGTIAFEEPVGDSGLQLQFTPGYWSNDVIKVNLR